MIYGESLDGSDRGIFSSLAEALPYWKKGWIFASSISDAISANRFDLDQDCTEECHGCPKCYEDPNDYIGMGWVGKDGQP